MNNKFFITIEGPDGAGKTTVITEVCKWLTSEGHDFISTREPGGIEIAEQIREVILCTKNTDMDPRTEALLYAAARRQHLVQKIIPALNDGRIVLCDRFVDSSLAYQGVARKLGVGEVFEINKFAIQNTMPDLTIMLMVEPEVGLERINKNRDASEINRLDLEALDFHKAVHSGFMSLAEKDPERIRVVDASQEPSAVIRDVIEVLKKTLPIGE